MKREAKIWGERWLVREDSTHATSYLKLEKNSICSWHKHENKYNLFVVLSGFLTLYIEELETIKEINLYSGEEFTIKPGQWHSFKTSIVDARVIEEMYVLYEESDIIRKKVGSKL